MGYTTDFYGKFVLDKPLAPEHKAYLTKFSETRRVRRDPDLLLAREDPTREAVGLPLGEDGGYFINGDGFRGQDRDQSIRDYNRPPYGQPGLWCQWVPTKDGTAIEWDGNEKFCDYVKWIEYLIAHFLTPWGYKLNGEIKWQGEDDSDFGKLIMKDSVLTVKPGRKVYD